MARCIALVGVGVGYGPCHNVALYDSVGGELTKCGVHSEAAHRRRREKSQAKRHEYRNSVERRKAQHELRNACTKFVVDLAKGNIPKPITAAKALLEAHPIKPKEDHHEDESPTGKNRKPTGP